MARLPEKQINPGLRGNEGGRIKFSSWQRSLSADFFERLGVMTNHLLDL